MTIVYLVPALKRVGPSKQLYNLIRFMDKTKFLPIVVTLSPEVDADSMRGDYDQLGVSVIEFSTSRWSVYINRRKLRYIVQNLRPDVVHSHLFRGDWASSHLRTEVPKICTLRSFPREELASAYGKIIGRLGARLHLSSVIRIRNAVACSVALTRKYDAIGVNAKTIRNGVDVERYRPLHDSEDGAVKRAGLRLPEKGLLVVIAASLIERKNPIMAIAAFRKACDRGLNAFLIVLGDGPLRSRCEQEASGGNVYFMGQVAEVLPYLQVASVFLSASSSEGLPNSVMEAMASGMAVCLSDIGPHKELWDLDRGAGQIFSLEGGVEDLSRKLVSVAETAKKCGGIARKVAVDELSSKAMSKKYQVEYARMALK